MTDFIVTNWLGIVVAVVSAMVIGTIWYAKPVFGTAWMKLAKLKDSDTKKNAGPAMAIMLLMAIVTAFVLQRFIVIASPDTMFDALKLSLWIWGGFVATYAIGGGVFEKRPPMLMAINLGNQLVTLLIMTAILYSINGV